MQGNRVEDDAVGHELGVRVLVAQVLSEVEALLVEQYIGSRIAVDGGSAHAGRGDMDKACARLQAELDTTTSASDVHVLNVGALREVLHVGGTVDDG